MPKKEVVTTDLAPKAIGPYSVAIKVGHFVYTAGQLGIDPKTGDLVTGGISAETEQVLKNLKNILEAAGSSMSQVVKTTVYLRDMKDFTAMNGVYAAYFTEMPPARSTVQVAALPKAGAVEIEVVALLGE